jgi:hypothetical protein
VHVDRATLLAEEAALKQAVRILAKKEPQYHTKSEFEVWPLPLASASVGQIII